jgi:hypothetical protein
VAHEHGRRGQRVDDGRDVVRVVVERRLAERRRRRRDAVVPQRRRRDDDARRLEALAPQVEVAALAMHAVDEDDRRCVGREEAPRQPRRAPPDERARARRGQQERSLHLDARRCSFGAARGTTQAGSGNCGTKPSRAT